MRDNPKPLGDGAAEGPTPQSGRELVLDTNVLLALWLFQDPRLRVLREALAARRIVWRATAAMIGELGHVLSRGFPARYQPLPELAQPPAILTDTPPAAAPWRCRDADDQKFLDLAWQRQLPLWTRDRDLLSLRKRAALRGLTIETPEQGMERIQL